MEKTLLFQFMFQKEIQQEIVLDTISLIHSSAGHFWVGEGGSHLPFMSDRATISSDEQVELAQIFPFCSTLSKFDESMLGVALFLLSIKICEESNICPILQKGAFPRFGERDLQNFFNRLAPRPPVSFYFICMFFHGLCKNA